MKRIFLILVALCMILTIVPVMAQNSEKEEIQNKDTFFSDISNHWAKDIIDSMAGKGIIKGMGDGKFMPDNQIKRSEFVAALHKALDIKMMYIKATDIKEFFKDVENDTWYASPLYDLAILNIVDEKDEFRPDSLITREEMVHYLINGYKYKLGNEADEPEEGSNNFNDSKSISPKYLKNVNWAVKLGFIRGRGENLFVPKGNTTRAEAMAVFERLLAQLDKVPGNNDDVRNEAKIRVETGFKKDGNIFTMILKIVNNSDKDVIISHSSTQKYDFSILDSNKDILYTWSMDRTFALMLTETVIEAGKSVEFVEKLETDSFEGLVDKAAYLRAFITGTSESFKIDEQGYEAKLAAEEAKLVVEPSFNKGDKVFEMKLKLTNKSDGIITINHTSSQKYDFKLLDENKEILYTWSADKLFMMLLSDTEINPGETIEFKEELDMEAYAETVGKAKYLRAFITGTSENFKIDEQGYETKLAAEEAKLVVEPSFNKGDKVFEMKLKLTNKSDGIITINHTSSQKYDFKLLDENKEILYTWSADKLFMMLLSDTEINPGETIEFKEELDMEAYAETVGKAKYLNAFIAGSSQDVNIDNDGYLAEIN